MIWILRRSFIIYKYENTDMVQSFNQNTNRTNDMIKQNNRQETKFVHVLEPCSISELWYVKTSSPIDIMIIEQPARKTRKDGISCLLLYLHHIGLSF